MILTKSTIRQIFLFLILINLTSCVDVYRFTIETLEPAEVELTTKKGDIAVVNSVKQQKRDYKAIYFYTDSLQNDSVHEINFAAGMLGEKITERLNSAPKFQVASTNHFAIKDIDTKDSVILSTLQQICKLKNLDGLVVLKELDFDTQESIEDYLLFGGIPAYYSKRSVTYNAKIIYYNARKRIIEDEQLISNTINKEDGSFSEDIALDFFPERFDVIDEFTELIAVDYCAKISPVWKPQSRFIYIGSSKWENAHLAFSNENYEEARRKWQVVAEKKTNKVGAQSAFNIAVTYEMEGYLEDALAWAKKAHEIRTLPSSLKYVRTLEKRIDKESTIHKQLEGEQKTQ